MTTYVTVVFREQRRRSASVRIVCGTQKRHLAVFCVKLTYNSEFTVVEVVELICFGNVMYVYVRNVRSLAAVGGCFRV